VSLSGTAAYNDKTASSKLQHLNYLQNMKNPVFIEDTLVTQAKILLEQATISPNKLAGQ
jgi:hypothetical protein